MNVNQANGDQRTPAHAKSPGYNVQRFIDDPAFIGEVVQFDLVVTGSRTSSETNPAVWDDGGTCVETDVVFTANTTHEWSHGLGETVTALIAEGLQITGLVEHESVPWDALPEQMTNDDRGEWRLTDRPWRLAASYTLPAVTPG